jgi:hypothetical protein
MSYAKPDVWVSSCRSVTGLVDGRRIGLPEESNPSRIWRVPSSGRCFAAGSSSVNLPCSTSCIAPTDVIALVMEAMEKMDSGVIGTPETESRVPNAPEYVIALAVPAMAVTAGIFRCSMPDRKTASMLFAPKSLPDCAPAASVVPPNSLRVNRCIRLVLPLKPPVIGQAPISSSLGDYLETALGGMWSGGRASSPPTGRDGAR